MDTAAEAFSEKGIFIPHQSYSKRGQHEVLKWAMSETLSQLKASFQRRIGVGPTQSAQSESAAEAKTKQFISQTDPLVAAKRRSPQHGYSFSWTVISHPRAETKTWFQIVLAMLPAGSVAFIQDTQPC